MNGGRRERAIEVFQIVIALPDGEREKRLVELCGDDAALLADVRKMLATDAEAPTGVADPLRPIGGNIAQQMIDDAPANAKPPAEPGASSLRSPLPTPASEQPGGREEPLPARIGPYKVISEIGHGGMGRVLLAVRDDEQIRRKVAIKLMKRGLDTDEMLRRFELERQVLNALNHPNIARCYDAGALSDGRPYIVMEYVEGLPLLEYCENQRLAMDERLEVFTQICDAVHHAHQNLVVHRDLKPSNILVDTKGHPKLLDFGIAKLVNPAIMGVALATEPGLHIMTPEYASPEQVRGEPVTTASDVYSLGVILYELLTGNRPYRLRTRVLEEIKRAICDDEPARPSAAATTTFPLSGKTSGGSAGSSTASTRESELRRLRRRFRGELDNIVLKALRKPPRYRYTSAAELGEDIDAFLHGLPVKAQPDSWGYRLRKFVLRNRTVVGSAAGVLVALGLAGTYWALARVRAEQVKTAAALVQATAAEHRATLAAAQTETFLRTLLQQSIEILPRLEGGSAALSAFARTLERVGTTVEKNATDAAGRRRAAELFSTASGALSGVRGGVERDLDSALRLADRAITNLASELEGAPGDISLRTALSMARVRRFDALKASGNRTAALAELSLARDLLETASGGGDADAQLRKPLAIVCKNLGDELASEDVVAAEKQLRRALDLRLQLARDNAGDADAELAVARVRLSLARVAEARGDLAAAALEHRASVEIRERLFRGNPDRQSRRDYAIALEALGHIERLRGDGVAAVESLRRSMELLEQRAEAETTIDARAEIDLIRVGAEYALALAAADQPQLAAEIAKIAYGRGERVLNESSEDPTATASDLIAAERDIPLLAAFASACDALAAPGVAAPSDTQLTAAKVAIRVYRNLTLKVPSEGYWAERLAQAELRRERIEAAGIASSQATK
ncbi:MAG: serine/threonine-protein kinase [Phycisphaerae bacterium]|nr:serine/threonine-protein kinase [Phycisphaerae bacterium]